jgi:hypothetical protein
MDVSVVVVNYNGRDLTADCLARIPTGVEAIVVDNGSADGSPEDIARRFPRVILMRNSINRGFAAAVNQGIERARGRYLCLLNNDARLSPDTLDVMVNYLEAHPDVGIAAPQLLHEDGRLQNSFAAIPSLATELLNKSLLRLLFPGHFPRKGGHTEPADVPSVIGACMLVRREVVDRIGGLDPAFFLFLEETDWCLRARRAGFRVVFLPQARVVHLQGRTRDKVACRARVEYVRSLFTFFRKRRPRSYPVLRVLYPLKNVVEFISQTLSAPFSGRARRRWRETATLLAWQAAGSPAHWGLSHEAAPHYVPLATGSHSWLVAADEAETFREFDRQAGDLHVLKDLRHKKMVRCHVRDRNFLVKIYKAGGFLRRLKFALFGSRADHELRMCLGVLERGLPTSPVVAIGECGAECCVVFEALPRWAQLQEVLLSDETDPRYRRSLLRDYGRFARRVHDAGVWQYDFNPSNVLVRGQEFKIIDFEKMTLHGCLSESVRLRSLAKMNRLPRLSRWDRLRFLRGYLHAYPDEAGRWKGVAREILRKGGVQAAIDVDRAGRRCVSENRDFGSFEIGESRGHYLKRRHERPRTGLAFDELEAMIGAPSGDGFRFEEVTHAIEQWKVANRRARQGGPLPVAVIVRQGETRGRIVYPNV